MRHWPQAVTSLSAPAASTSCLFSAELSDTPESDRAIEDCNQAIKLNPDNADAFSNRAAAYRTKGQYERAIEA